MKIKGKCVLITGSAKRCGAELAKSFASDGAEVIIHCNRSTREAEELLATLPGNGHRIIAADFSSPAGVAELISQLGRVDIVINNASLFFRPGSPEDLAGAVLYHQVNFLAPKQILEAWAKQDLPEGCAVNILDQAVLNPGTGGYWQSRYDLMHLGNSLARTLGERNLRINAVAPGPLLPPYWKPDSKMEKTLPTLPLHRPVAVADFVNAVKLLCTSDSITGAILPVDCGQHLLSFHEKRK
ncbi:MAG: SDR family oxidoreductase [Lentisphaerae bacterium]|nr:SDR family oxidoreductase [Lentisphaerota bacterium]